MTARRVFLASLRASKMANPPHNAMLNSTTTNMKRAKAQDLNYKLQLPEIMQQQQTKLSSLKKQHEQKFRQEKKNLNL
jgi:hypothetical protein